MSEITKNPTLTIKESDAKLISSAYDFLLAFWNNGGKEKYEQTKELRAANGIPDSQWFKANLMGLIDDAEITYDPTETSSVGDPVLESTEAGNKVEE